METPSDGGSRRRLIWVVSVVIAFILGYLLAHRRAPDCATGATAGAAAGAADLGQAPGSAGQGAGGKGGASSGSLGADSGAANAGAGGGQGAEAPVGGVGSRTPHPGGDAISPSASSDTSSNGMLAALSGAAGGTGPDPVDGSPTNLPAGTRGARDFSFDRTGLPRYPTGVTRVGSVLSTPPGTPGDSGNTVVIQTTDSFDTVVAWYHGRLPSTWKQQVIGNLEDVAKQVSVQNLLKMFTSQQGAEKAGTDSAPPVAAAPAGPHQSVAIWSAPDNSNQLYRSVMVTAATGKPTTITMKRTAHP